LAVGLFLYLPACSKFPSESKFTIKSLNRDAAVIMIIGSPEQILTVSYRSSETFRKVYLPTSPVIGFSLLHWLRNSRHFSKLVIVLRSFVDETILPIHRTGIKVRKRSPFPWGSWLKVLTAFLY
jgi:hypothetical protein